MNKTNIATAVSPTIVLVEPKSPIVFPEYFEQRNQMELRVLVNGVEYVGHINGIYENGHHIYKLIIPVLSTAVQQSLNIHLDTSKVMGMFMKALDIRLGLEKKVKDETSKQRSDPMKTKKTARQEIRITSKHIDLNHDHENTYTCINAYVPNEKEISVTAYHAVAVEFSAVAARFVEVVVPVGCHINVVHTSGYDKVGKKGQVTVSTK